MEIIQTRYTETRGAPCGEDRFAYTETKILFV